jgi:7-cyano-7-deazaguanine synthase in queuosine biosynthesis
MCTERVILCGGAAESNLPDRHARPVRLQQFGPRRNVNLVLQDVEDAMWRNVPPLFRDLIDLAVYVYCGDQAVHRGEDNEWRRRLLFRVPVRQPDFWASHAVSQQLTATLSFLTEDEYFFEFVPLKKEPPRQQSIEFPTEQWDDVVLFSGGLDSLAGAVQESVTDRQKVILVHHQSITKFAQRHRRLTELLNAKAGVVPPQQIRVRINKAERLSREYTQRSRSFLFAALGATVAALAGRNRIKFYENGVVSLNLPPSPQVVGARASRTTHPQVLAGFARLLTAVAGHAFSVENSFLWKTKTEVVRLIADAGCSDLIRHSTSCTHTWEMSNAVTHCGKCSQCIDRRFAVIAANQEKADPGDAYGVDLFLGARERRPREQGDPRTMLVSYLEMANDIESMNARQFFARFGEAARVLRHIDGDADATAVRVFDLYRRHARQVTGVVDQGLARNASAIRRNELPPSCLVRLVSDAGATSPSTALAQIAPVNGTADSRPTLPDNLFRQKGRGWDVRFNGGRDFMLLPSVGAFYLHELLGRPGVTVSAAELVCRVNRHEKGLPAGSAGQAADHEAIVAYRVKLRELAAEIETARKYNDTGKQITLECERDALLKEITTQTGLGGRLRRVADDRERVRQSVTTAIRRAIREIAVYDQALANHLARPNLQRGQSLTYTPAFAHQLGNLIKVVRFSPKSQM